MPAVNLDAILAAAKPLGDHAGEKTWVTHDGRHVIKARRIPERFSSPLELAASARIPRLDREGSVDWFAHIDDPASLGLGEGEWFSSARPWRAGRAMASIAPEELVARWITHAVAIATHVRDLHDVGMAHGDLQPHNVLVTSDGGISLIDLPLLATNPGDRDHVIGSAPLMAPELWGGGAPSTAADVYALGTLICWMSAGKIYPLAASNLTEWAVAHCEQSPRIPEALGGKVGGVVSRMLARDPEQRPALQEILDALRAASPQELDETPLYMAHAPLLERVDALARAPRGATSSALIIEGVRGAGKSELLHQLCARLELRGDDVAAIFGQRLSPRMRALTPQRAGAMGPWALALDLIARHEGTQPTPGQGDQLHTFESLTNALFRALEGSDGLILLWDDIDQAGPDIRAWLTHALQAARERDVPFSLIATSTRRGALATSAPRLIEVDTLPQPDMRQWQRWRARSMRASLRDIGLARWESLHARHGHSIGDMLTALEEELGIRRDDTSSPAILTAPTRDAIDALMRQGAFQEALLMCERLHAMEETPFSLDLFETWVEALLRSGADATSHDILTHALERAREDVEERDVEIDLALLLARLLHGRGVHGEGLSLLLGLSPEDGESFQGRRRIARLALWRSQLSLSSGSFDEATRHAEDGLAELGVMGRARAMSEATGFTSEIAHLFILKHAAHALRGKMNAITSLQDLLPQLEHEDIPAILRARANAYIAIGLGHNEEREASTEAYLRALEQIERAGLDAELPMYLLNVGTAYHSQGRLGLAREYYARGMRIAQDTTRPTTRMLLLSNSAAIDVLLGRFDEAHTLLERSLALAREHALVSHELMTRSYQASLAAMRGEHQRALELLDICFAAGTPPPPAHVELLLTMAEANLSLDDLDAVHRQLDEARELIEEHNLAALEDHHAILWSVLRWTDGGSLEVMTGIERFRKALHSALETANYQLVLKFAPWLMARVQQESLQELVDEVADLHQRARAAVASGLGKELREDFFANFPELHAASTRQARGALDASPRAHITAPQQLQDERLIERFYRMLSLNEIILHQRDPQQLWRRALEIALSLSGAERGFLLLDEQGGDDATRVGKFLIAASQDIGGDAIPRPHLKVSLTIAEEAARTGRTVATVNAREDERFNAALSVVDLDLTSVLCVPVRDASGLLGALYLDHRFHPGIFQGETRRMMEAFGHQLAIGITNGRRLEELEQTVTQLETARSELDALLGEREAMLEGLEERVARLSEEVERQRDSRHSGLRATFPDIAYASPIMERLLQQVERVARSDIPVVIHGESGVGKELIASALHSASPRSPGPFVPVNCGAIPENLFESELFGHNKGAFTGATRDREGLFKAANGGTIFLDELGEMPLAMQVKLLRVLQERKVRPVGSNRAEPIDVRVVAATNRDLQEMIAQGSFREDLFYRLAAFPVTIPALRERREDIPLIAHRLLARIAPETIGRELKLSPEAAHLLGECHWPGNVRQLENTLRAASVMCEGDVISERELAPLIQLRPREGAAPTSTEAGPSERRERAPKRASRRGRKPKASKEDVIAALEDAQDDYAIAAESLGVSERTLYRYVNRYELD